MNILFLYNSTQTYANALFEHVNAFSRHSKHQVYFAHHEPYADFSGDFNSFDAVILHYSVRLPFNHLTEETANQFAFFKGLKILFIQDEYDHTHRAWYWIKRLGFQLVFTVVPEENIARVYPPAEFPGIRFVSNLTGYVPEDLPETNHFIPPSRRDLLVGYRARSLPLRYGQLGREKVDVGHMIKEFCDRQLFRHDIDWNESARIYGIDWYAFIASCRAMLGSESGSNIFDWDGLLGNQIQDLKAQGISDKEIYQKIIAPLELHGLMNQVSPRIFEAIALKTVLVLFEGQYSGVVQPGLHFIELKKDGSNLNEVFQLLEDNKYVDQMVETAYRDIIESGKYTYQTFLNKVDTEISAAAQALNLKIKARRKVNIFFWSGIVTAPTRVTVPLPAKISWKRKLVQVLLPWFHSNYPKTQIKNA